MYCTVACCNYRMVYNDAVQEDKVLISSPLMYYVATTLYYTLVVQKCIKMCHNVSSCSYNKGQYSTSESIA